MNLADALVPKSFDDGEIIIKQGDVADGMYFVEAGTIKITILDEDGKEIEVKVLVIQYILIVKYGDIFNNYFHYYLYQYRE